MTRMIEAMIPYPKPEALDPNVKPAFGRFPIVPERVTVEDLRGREDELSLDREGFVLLNWPSQVKDFRDPEEVRQRLCARGRSDAAQDHRHIESNDGWRGACAPFQRSAELQERRRRHRQLRACRLQHECRPALDSPRACRETEASQRLEASAMRSSISGALFRAAAGRAAWCLRCALRPQWKMSSIAT